MFIAKWLVSYLEQDKETGWITSEIGYEFLVGAKVSLYYVCFWEFVGKRDSLLVFYIPIFKINLK